MSATTAAGSKSASKGAEKKRGGRKTKAEWRKKIDIADVEEGLEEMREEERQGGAVVEKRQDTDLFVVDVAGDEKTKVQQRQRKKLRVDEILDRRSKVPAAIIGTQMSEERRKRKVANENRNILKKVAGFVDGKKTTPHGLKTKSAAGTYDIWGAPPAAETKSVVSRQKMAHLEIMPAVEVAHPGASYRPDEKQHKELINKAGAEYAMKLRKNEEYSEFKNFRGLQATDGLNECAAIIAEEIEQERANRIARMELARANQDSDDEDEDEDKAVADGVEDDKTIIDSDEEMEVELPTTSKDPKRKTRADRNRQRRLGKEKAEKFEAKALKKKLIQVDKAKWLNRIVDQEAIEAEVVVEHKRKLAHEKSLKPLKKIGKFKVPQLLEAVKLTEDLPASLRQLQPEGNGFSEVFNSLMKRNLVEPEVAFNQKEAKLKVKMTEKWSYKDFK